MSPGHTSWQAAAVTANGIPASAAVGPGPRKVLLIDDDTDYLTVLRLALKGTPGIETVAAASAEEALTLLDAEPFDLVLTDLQLPGRSGLEFVGAARERGLRTPILVLTAHGSVSAAVDALKLGAQDYLQKPVDPERLRALVSKLAQSAPPVSRMVDVPHVTDDGAFEGILGASPAMREMFDRIERVARTDATVLIVGESGTGKELVARAIHRRSARASGPIVPVHTGAIPRELIASELFGHEKGSFTGAVTTADGKFDAAMRGTLFLDEIGTMELAVQVSLLRVLETFRFTRVGGRKEREADVRVVAATHRNLLEMVREGTFREDLYYRLNVFTVTLPPLRERAGDVGLIAEHYLREFGVRHGTPARRLSPAALERLSEHSWPGNVRELRNVMEQTAVFSQSEEVRGDEVQMSDTPVVLPAGRRAWSSDATASSLPPAPGSYTAPFGLAASAGPTASSPLARAARSVLGPGVAGQTDEALVLRLPVGTTLEEAEKRLILRTLEVIGGNKQKAARLLGISRRSLYNKLAGYGITTGPSSDDEAAAGEVDES